MSPKSETSRVVTSKEYQEYGWPYESDRIDDFTLRSIPDAAVTIAEGAVFVGKSLAVLTIHGLKNVITKSRHTQ